MREGATPESAASGIGNQVSMEFNLAYRWHSCIGAADEEFTNKTYQQMFGKRGEDLSLPELVGGLGKWQAGIPDDPAERTFAGLQRKPDGTFDDGELMNIMTEAIEEVAGKFHSNFSSNSCILSDFTFLFIYFLLTDI